jgi:hypothetical protein
MAPMLIPEDVVRRIAAERAHVDERGGVGTRREPSTYCSHRTALRGEPLRSSLIPSGVSVLASLRSFPGT